MRAAMDELELLVLLPLASVSRLLRCLCDGIKGLRVWQVSTLPPGLLLRLLPATIRATNPPRGPSVNSKPQGGNQWV